MYSLSEGQILLWFKQQTTFSSIHVTPGIHRHCFYLNLAFGCCKWKFVTTGIRRCRFLSWFGIWAVANVICDSGVNVLFKIFIFNHECTKGAFSSCDSIYAGWTEVSKEAFSIFWSLTFFSSWAVKYHSTEGTLFFQYPKFKHNWKIFKCIYVCSRYFHYVSVICHYLNVLRPNLPNYSMSSWLVKLL